MADRAPTFETVVLKERPLTTCRRCGKSATHGMATHARYCAEGSKLFWAKVNKTDSCWLWTGSKTSAGYGDLVRLRKHVLAHRHSWTLAHGAIPKGLLVLHKCDTPLCVRPDHLFLGTDRDNTNDKRNKDRGARGERNRHAKLTEDQVRSIRRLYVWGNGRRLASRYGVTQSAVACIVNNRTWRHLK